MAVCYARTVDAPSFDANASAKPTNGIHNDIDTNGELAGYDPMVYAIIDEVFAATTWRYRCP